MTIGDCYKQSYAHKLDNLERKHLEKQVPLPRLDQEIAHHLQGST